MSIESINDKKLKEGFKKHFNVGATFLIIGIPTSVILLGIPFIVYGLIRIYQCIKFKQEINRRVTAGNFNPNLTNEKKLDIY